MANNKKQPKDTFPDNMPTGMNMTWWHMDDVETLIASMQLKIDYLQQRIEKTEEVIEKLEQKNKEATNKLHSFYIELEEARTFAENKLHELESRMNNNGAGVLKKNKSK